MRKRNGILAAVVAAAAAVTIAGCSYGGGATGGTAKDLQTSRQDLNTYEQAQPAPHFNYSVIRQDMIEVEAAQALGEHTTSFFFNMGEPDPIDSCPSVGDPIPNTAQLTNPQQPLTWQDGNNNTSTAVTIGNIDPNGIYSAANSTGTNVMCLLSDGQQQLRYWEGFVYTVNGSAIWDYVHHRVITTGGVQMPTCKQATQAGKSVEVCTK